MKKKSFLYLIILFLFLFGCKESELYSWNSVLNENNGDLNSLIKNYPLGYQKGFVKDVSNVEEAELKYLFQRAAFLNFQKDSQKDILSWFEYPGDMSHSFVYCSLMKDSKDINIERESTIDKSVTSFKSIYKMREISNFGNLTHENLINIYYYYGKIDSLIMGTQNFIKRDFIVLVFKKRNLILEIGVPVYNEKDIENAKLKGFNEDDYYNSDKLDDLDLSDSKYTKTKLYKRIKVLIENIKL